MGFDGMEKSDCEYGEARDAHHGCDAAILTGFRSVRKPVVAARAPKKQLELRRTLQATHKTFPTLKLLRPSSIKPPLHDKLVSLLIIQEALFIIVAAYQTPSK